LSVIEEQHQDPMTIFLYALKAPESKRQYPRRFKMFLDYLSLKGTIQEQAKQFLINARANPQWAQDNLIHFIAYQNERVSRGEISPSTIPNYYRATKLFCEMNDLTLSWKKIARGLAKVRKAANDRAPTLEELRQLVEYPDRRIKPIVYTMASSGIRIGAWDYLQWKHVTPLTNQNEEVIAAKLLVYPGDHEQYYTFITPEAYTALKEWMDFRTQYGEKINGDSWVMRDLWQTTNMNYGAKFGLATFPKKLKSSGIKRLIEHALWEQGIRHRLAPGVRRHEWKAAHGIRKYYKSRTEQVMRPINVYITMGHDIGISESYYKPSEREVLDDYLKAVDLLTINSDKLILQKQVLELKEENDNQLRNMQDQFTVMQSQVQALISTLGSIDVSSKNQIAKQLIEKGMYKSADQNPETSKLI
jgi:hypothetical protein